MPRTVRTHQTSVTAIARGLGNVWVVKVVGFDGSFDGIRRTFDDAMATARFYAELFDAPRSIF